MERIEISELNCVYDIPISEVTVQDLFDFFMDNNEVMYFCRNSRLVAVATIGDLFAYLEKKTNVLVNESFTKLHECDEEAANLFFMKYPTVHELPIVDENNVLIAILRSDKENSEHIHAGLKEYAEMLYYGGEDFWLSQAEIFLKAFWGKMYVLELPDDLKFRAMLKTEEEQKEFDERRNKTSSQILMGMSLKEEKEYWGEYEVNISKKFLEEFNDIKVSEQNGVTQYANSFKHHYITFKNGKRITPNNTGQEKNRIIIVGPCTMFGAYVTDKQTIEFYLREMVEGTDYQVVNWSSCGWGYEFQYLLTEPICDNDIVVMAVRNKRMYRAMLDYDNVTGLGDFSSAYNSVINPLNNILDTSRHSNYEISKVMANKIYNAIQPVLISDLSIGQAYEKIQDYYISWDINLYYKRFCRKYNLDRLEGKVGAIVMNCNPFTKGHYYLIKYAKKYVDNLIIFVVEEDASVFSFQDRYEMVKRGVEDIENITVVPSGKYNISKNTFSQYFDKEKEITEVMSMEFDVRVFCEVIAKNMNITYRFAGQEPFDKVTNAYNETMKKILPEYNIFFLEVPRASVEGQGDKVISATEVRKMIKEREMDLLELYLPKTTINYVKEMI